jgi:eukaryotic-like serine/threonine-protein kinase
MNRSLPRPSDLWSPSQARYLDAACNGFEAAWAAGQRPRIEAYLDEAPAAARPDLLRELLALELAYRLRQGETPTPDEYCRRFPEHAEPIHATFSEIAPERAGPPAGGPSRTPLPDQLASTLLPGGPRPFPGPAPAVPGYEILGVLGRGGMGIVYQARQVKLKRLVALKMILAGDEAEPQPLDRLRAEAEAVARLQHPNIVQLYEIGEHDGRPYLALEYVAGGSLEQRLHGAPLPPEPAARLLAAVARAVHHAHRHGIVHRDLKPANILLRNDEGRMTNDERSPKPEARTPQGEGGVRPSALGIRHSFVISHSSFGIPKVTDFGLAKQLGSDSGRTHSGAILGTPSYMAPEQAEGKAKTIGPAADVFALGTILYETLTGRPPFRGATVLETLEQVCSQEPVPPSRLQPKLPRDLETICLKCLHKEPPKRYGSAEALAEDLERFLAGEPVRARPTPAWERALKWARRRKAAAALLVVSTLALLGAVAGGLWAVEERAQKIEKELRERKHTDALRDKAQELQSKGQDAAAGERWSEAEVHLASALQVIHSAEPWLDDLRASVERRLAEVQKRLAEVQKQSAHAEARRQAGSKHRQFFRLRDEALLHGLMLRGVDLPANLAAARDAAEAALALVGMQAEAPGTPVLAEPFTAEERQEITQGCYELLLVLAEVRAQQNDRRLLEEAVRILDRAAQLGPPTRAYHLRRARYLNRLGDGVAAAIARQRADALEPVTALDHFLLGDELVRQGDLRGAVRELDRAGGRQPGHFWAHYFLAVCHLGLQRPDLAKGPLDVCLAWQPPDFPWAHILRGMVYGQRNDLSAAEEEFEKAARLKPDAEARYTLALGRGVVRLYQKKYPDAAAELRQAIELRPDRHHAYLKLAEVYERQGMLDQALAQLDAAVACAGAAEVPVRQALYRTRAELHAGRQDAEAALRDLERAIALEPADTSSAELAETHLTRGRILHRQQRRPEALAAYEAALKVPPTPATEARLLPSYAAAYRGRGELLYQLGCYAEAVNALSEHLRWNANGKASAEVYLLRGSARVGSGDYAGAVEDYTRALDLQPDSKTYALRGWAHLALEALPLAQRDFEAALRLDAESADAYSGRGHVHAKRRHYAQAIADAENAVARADGSARLLCSAARVVAEVVAQMDADPGQRGALGKRSRLQDRALELVRQAMAHLPPGERPALWLQISRDRALRAVRASPEYARLAAQYTRPGK